MRTLKSLAAILNFSWSGRMERERKLYQRGERQARGRVGEEVTVVVARL